MRSLCTSHRWSDQGQADGDNRAVTVERCFSKLKKARRVTTRYDKTAENFLSFIDTTSIRLWVIHLPTRLRLCRNVSAYRHPWALNAEISLLFGEVQRNRSERAFHAFRVFINPWMPVSASIRLML